MKRRERERHMETESKREISSTMGWRVDGIQKRLSQRNDRGRDYKFICAPIFIPNWAAGEGVGDGVGAGKEDWPHSPFMYT